MLSSLAEAWGFISPFFDGLKAKDVVGPMATVIAAMAAVRVTYQFNRRQLAVTEQNNERQVIIAHEKLKLDLFDRRISLLNSAMKTCGNVIDWKWGPIPNAPKIDIEKPDITPLVVQSHGAPFLFPNEEQIREILDRLIKSLVIVQNWGTVRLAYVGNPQGLARAFVESQNVLLNDVPAILDELRAAMRPHVRVTEKI